MAKALIAVDLQEEYFGKDRNQEQFGDAFSNPALKRYIREKGITEIEIAGIDSTKCAYLTAKGAVKHDLKTSMLIDAIDTIYPQDVEKCEKDLKSRGVIYR